MDDSGSRIEVDTSTGMVSTFNEEIDSQVSIDLPRIRSSLQRLRTKAYLPLEFLSGVLLEDFKLVSSHVDLLYDTDAYQILYDEIRATFEDLTEFRPGTIGSYCAGCLDLESGMNCSPICAGSVPPPKNIAEWSFCDQSIILASYSKTSGFSFSLLNEVQDQDRSLLVVPFSRPELFPGLSSSEVEYLKELGFRQINIVTYSIRDRSYRNLFSGFVNVEDLPLRSNHGIDYRWIFLIMLILIIIILIGISYFKF